MTENTTLANYGAKKNLLNLSSFRYPPLWQKLKLFVYYFLAWAKHMRHSDLNSNYSRAHKWTSPCKHMILGSIWALFHADQAQNTK